MPAPAAIILWGGWRSTQMAANTTHKLPKPTMSPSQPTPMAVLLNWSETSQVQEAPEVPISRSSAATTRSRPSLTSGCRMDVAMLAIVVATEGVLAPKALVEGDIDSWSYDRASTSARFAVGSGCYERSSCILTSNEFQAAIDGWIFGSPCHKLRQRPDRTVNAGLGAECPG